MAVANLVTHIHFRLLQHPSQSTRQAAVHLILADLCAQLTAATEEGMAVVALPPPFFVNLGLTCTSIFTSFPF